MNKNDPIRHADRRTNLSGEEFFEKYGDPGLPVVILDLMQDWPAMERWTPEFFKSQYGSIEVTVERTASFDHLQQHGLDTRRMTFGDYLDYMQSTQEAHPYYLSNWNFSELCPQLADDFTIPDYFHSWHLRLPEAIRPTFRWFYIGPRGSGSRMHVDGQLTSAWNGVVRGRKRWLFYSPDQAPYLYAGQVDAFEPDLDKYPLFEKAQPIVVIQNAGDVVFTPGGWWHQVTNEEACISLTENFVNRSNYKTVRESPEIAELPEEMKQAIATFIPEFFRD